MVVLVGEYLDYIFHLHQDLTTSNRITICTRGIITVFLIALARVTVLNTWITSKNWSHSTPYSNRKAEDEQNTSIPSDTLLLILTGYVLKL